MNLQIEIPESVEHDTISLTDAFKSAAIRKNIEYESLYDIYNNCTKQENFLFLNEHTLFSINSKTIQKGDHVLYTKNNINKPVTIVDIHHDDYPNTYYTIKFDDTKEEKQTVGNYLKLVEYLDLDITQKKRKREFASYNIGSSMIVAGCKFLYHEDDDYFTKIYIFDDDFKKHIIVAKIMCEIYFQKEAIVLSKPDRCNFLVPKIFSYGYVNTDKYGDQIVFYLKMENTKCIPFNNVADLKLNNTVDYLSKYVRLKYKAIGINACLKCNGFYHNDLHSNNIMINDKNDDMYIIDYGESSKIDNNILGFQDHKYCINCHHEKKYSRYFF
jgi:hypothetical protein